MCRVFTCNKKFSYLVVWTIKLTKSAKYIFQVQIMFVYEICKSLYIYINTIEYHWKSEARKSLSNPAQPSNILGYIWYVFLLNSDLKTKTKIIYSFTHVLFWDSFVDRQWIIFHNSVVCSFRHWGGTVIYPRNSSSSDCPFPNSLNAKTNLRFL